MHALIGVSSCDVALQLGQVMTEESFGSTVIPMKSKSVLNAAPDTGLTQPPQVPQSLNGSPPNGFIDNPNYLE